MLTLHFHPLSSFCHKVLIALYENGTPFAPRLVDLGDAEQRAAFQALWPIGKFPVLQDSERDRMVPESSVIIEYLDQRYPGRTRFIPQDAEEARIVRFGDRFYDLHVHLHMQKIVGDRLRPAGAKDPHGVADARTRMAAALALADKHIAGRTWAMGESFTLADCAAAPALFYADWVEPVGGSRPQLSGYRARLLAHPAVARAVDEARPYRHYFPLGAPDRD